MKLNREVFDIIELSQSTLDKYRVVAEKSRIDLIFDCNLDECLVNADPKRKEQVFHNLISNAINHTSEGGEIRIVISKDDKKVRIEIRDSGDGIPEEDLEYIWDRYYKSNSNKDKLVRGTGLGLSIVKNILEAHDLKFGVSSKVGEGSVFYFEIDCVD